MHNFDQEENRELFSHNSVIGLRNCHHCVKVIKKYLQTHRRWLESCFTGKFFSDMRKLTHLGSSYGAAAKLNLVKQAG